MTLTVEAATAEPEVAAEREAVVNRAVKQATVVTVLAAALPTALAAEGMTGVGVDLLALPVAVAVALATFLELALMASALHDRVAALDGRPSRGMATWVFSGTSGVISAVHELVSRTADGSSHWTTDPASLLAGAVRLVAPLVAAYLWHRVLTGMRQRAEGRTVAEIRRARRLHHLARAAVVVRQREGAGDGRVATWRAWRARVAMDRRHDAVLRHVPATDPRLAIELSAWLDAMGAADHFPIRTMSAPPERHIHAAPAQAALTTGPASDGGHDGEVADGSDGGHGEVADSGQHDEEPPAPGAQPAPAEVDPAGPEHESPAASTPDDGEVAANGGEVANDRGEVAANGGEVSADGGEVVRRRGADPAKLAAAVVVLRQHGQVSGAQMAAALTAAGHQTSARSGLRWVDRAVEETGRQRRGALRSV